MSRERFVTFSRQLIPRVVDGSKTMTRRIAKLRDPSQTHAEHDDDGWPMYSDEHGVWHREACPYGAPGTRLIVREDAWMFCERVPNGVTKLGRPKWRYVPLHEAPVLYCADHPERPTPEVEHPETENQWGWRFKVARFLPRWASRLTLEVVDVRVERLNRISEEDAMAEGCESNAVVTEDGSDYSGSYACDRFAILWESIYGPETFDSRYVWAVTFRVLEGARVAA